ncbi:hypothetical protein ALT1000_140026 [Alteromonas macleodii]
MLPPPYVKGAEATLDLTNSTHCRRKNEQKSHTQRFDPSDLRRFFGLGYRAGIINS